MEGRSRFWAKLLATLYQVYVLRPTGRLPTFKQEMEPRAERWLAVLAAPSQKLGFRIQVELLCREADLFMDEAALKPACLRLYVRAFDLREQFPALRELLEAELSKAPISKLFSAIVAQGHVNGATSIRVTFKAEPSQVEGGNLSKAIHVWFLEGEEWKAAMSMPENLSKPLEGAILRVETVGYEKIRPLFWPAEKLPDGLSFTWSKDYVELGILS
jgi:hypothetical protein